MKYIPSIAFEEMSGSAKGVTAKGVFKRLTTMWKSLTPAQILAWNKLALSQEGRSVLGSKAKISGANLFIRLNYWIVACGGQPSVTPPELVGVENPSSATIVCQGETFTFKLDQALADNGGIYLVIEATEGQSNGVTRAHAKASGIKLVEEPTADAIDIRAPTADAINIRADYVAKYGAPSAAAPKIFFRYYYVNSSTGEKSGTMLAEVKWAAAAAGGGEP